MPADTRATTPFPASFDSVILAAVVAECQALIGSRVQRVHQSGSDGIAIALRRAGRSRVLLASLHPRWGRLHLADDVEVGDASPFSQQARGRLEGTTLRSMTAQAFERIAVCGFEGLEGEIDLIIEIMGRHSNLILREGGLIAGAMRVVGEHRSRIRPVVPHRTYAPPPQRRPTPETVNAADLRSAAASAADRPAWRTMLEAVAGIGPPLAADVCARADLNPHLPLSAGGVEAALGGLHDLAERVRAAQFSPVIYTDAGGAPIAYAAFPVVIYEDLAAAASTMSAAVDTVTAHQAGAAAVDEARTALAAVVTQASRRVRRALAAVDEDMRAAAGAGRAREYGELILAYLSRVEPGAQVLTVPDFQCEPVQISLDPTRSGVENAQTYFRRHTKARAALKRLPVRRTELEAEQTFLESTVTAIAQADSLDDLWEVEQDLIAAGLRRRARTGARPKAVAVARTFDLGGGQVVRAGRSARENEHLTFDVAGPEDWWFHARGMPGAHVILQARGRRPDQTAMDAAARIAAYYSAGRTSGKVAVTYTRRRLVRRVRGGRPGQVQVTGEQTITVSPGLPTGPSGPGTRAKRSARRG